MVEVEWEVWYSTVDIDKRPTSREPDSHDISEIDVELST